MTVQLIQGDCIEMMKTLSDKSIDAIITDPPYGTTACKWDSVIPFAPMWEQLKRIIKPNGAIVLFGSQPFTSALVMSQPKLFKHEWIWIKNRGSNFANTVREPMKEHESVLIFSDGKWTYNKQMQERTGGGGDRAKYLVEHNSRKREGTRAFEGREHHEITELRVPSSWQKFNVETGLHPTQKPIALLEYLIKTYTNEGETVLDFTAGSGTTGVAAINTNRKCVLIERDDTYCEIIRKRIGIIPVTSALQLW